MPRGIMQQPEVVSLIAGHSQRVTDAANGTLASFVNEVIDGLARYRLAALGDE